jgi:ABC-type sugar transport system ATPase subunit
VRPEHLVWHDGGPGGSAPLVEGKAIVVEPLGSDTLVSLEVAGQAIVARLPPRIVRRTGEAVRLMADPANLHFFDKATGIRQTAQET